MEVEQWKRNGIVDFIGGVKDVRPFLQACSVYVLPSYREGTPRSVLEAMATGRPVITTDTPGCRETVQAGENGFLVPVKSVSALLERMQEFVRNHGLVVKMGRQSRRLAEQKYDVRKVNHTILEALEIGDSSSAGLHYGNGNKNRSNSADSEDHNQEETNNHKLISREVKSHA